MPTVSLPLLRRRWLLALLFGLAVPALLILTVGSQLFAPARPARQMANIPLRAVDKQGRPIPAFGIEAVLNLDEGLRADLCRGTNGQTNLVGRLWNRPDLRTVDLAVHSPGFTPALIRFDGPGLERLVAGEAEIEMESGKQVELVLRLPLGMDWPAQGEPSLYFEQMKEAWRPAWFIPGQEESQSKPGAATLQTPVNQLGAVWAEPGLARFRLTEDTPPFRVAVNLPGVLRAFETPPLTLSDFPSGRLEIDLPRPASLWVQFDLGDVPPDSLLFDRAQLRVMWLTRKGPQAPAELACQRTVSAPWSPLELTDLAPGTYRVGAVTVASPGVADLPGAVFPINPGRFGTIETVELAPGESKQVRVAYTPLDPNSFRGDRTAVLHIRKPDGSPAAGETVQVTYHAEHYGGLPVFTCTVPKSGTVSIDDITTHAPAADSQPYAVFRKAPGKTLMSLGSFGFSSASGAEEFVFFLAPAAGDLAPNVELINVGSGKKVPLSDFRGRLVLMEFWATWCGPCQEPIGELDRWIVERQAAWKGRVAIVPLSIDADLDALKGYLAGRDRDQSNYYWSQAAGDTSAAKEAFVVRSVPTKLLIAPDGRILLRDPSKQDIEAAIAKAVAD